MHCQIINFTDPNLKTKLLTYGSVYYFNSSGNYAALHLDGNFDGEITVTEAQVAVGLNLNGGEITSLLDLQYFINVQSIGIMNNDLLGNFVLPDLPLLVSLTCSHNSLLSIDLSNMPLLEVLDCQYTNITSLDTSLNPMLTSVNCSYNQISAVDFSSNPLLTNLECAANAILALDVSNLPDLTSLKCWGNQLSVLDLSQQNLTTLECGDNLITSLELSGHTNLTNLRCQNNLIETLDLSFKDIPVVYCNNNSQLRFLFIKNGGTDWIFLEGCSALEYICADPSEFSMVYSSLGEDAYDCQINSYCTFTPGGEYYVADGNVRFDTGNDGCSISDMGMPYQRLSILGPEGTTTRYAHGDGTFLLAIPSSQQFTVTPIFENNYFSSSPTSITTQMPDGDTAFLANFCIVPNGVHADLEIYIVPNVAIPGFNTTYRIEFKNKGTHSQSDVINFLYDDDHMDFISSTETPNTISSGAISWNFTDLQPFETRSIDVTFNINAPTDTPPVINGQILTFSAAINSTGADETPVDNSFTLNQTTVGSYDPNDKTCLEGNVVSPTVIGEYVHYLVRFENTGTFAAQNIVVADMIDASQFDIATLIPLSGSHSFETRVRGNLAEFIFENINLPFDDANNDGFVAFKIKTKPTLVLGDTFSNTAAIYFDYNFPIITNTETTTIAALGKQDFEFGNFLTLYPNPTTETLHLKKSAAISVSSIIIYNMLGQQLIVIPNANSTETVDVSSLGIGNYFLKIQSDKGASIAKFVKQ